MSLSGDQEDRYTSTLINFYCISDQLSISHNYHNDNFNENYVVASNSTHSCNPTPPSILRGINNFLKEQKRQPKSALISYYTIYQKTLSAVPVANNPISSGTNKSTGGPVVNEGNN